MGRRIRLLCTPATVGVLKERGLSTAQISRKVHASLSTVRRYWREWCAAEPKARDLARIGVNIP
jgi:hypothetical protein